MRHPGATAARRPASRAARLLAALLAAAGPGAGWCGEALVTGAVRGKPRVTPRPVLESKAYADRDLHSAARFDYKRLENVVVFAEPIEEGGARPPATAAAGTAWLAVEKRWRGLRLAPGFLAVPAGAMLRVANRSGKPATVFAGSGSPGSLGLRLEPGAEGSARLEARGLYRVFCLEDDSAAARVLAVAQPFALAGPDGRYELRLAPGRWRVTAWHERLPPQSLEIEAAEGAPRVVDFVLSVAGLPEIP